MSSLAISVRPSVCPSFVEITSVNGSEHSTQSIDLKSGLNIG